MKWFYVLALVVLVSAQKSLVLDVGNSEARQTMNAALLDAFVSAEYDKIYNIFFQAAPERYSDCAESPLALKYPDLYTPGGLLDHILSTRSIKLGYFQALAILPSFKVENGAVTSGFYPELAKALMSRVADHYDISDISIEWVSIAAAADFYPRHVAGDYDVIFMDLFKYAMWSAPVAERSQLWTSLAPHSLPNRYVTTSALWPSPTASTPLRPPPSMALPPPSGSSEEVHKRLKQEGTSHALT